MEENTLFIFYNIYATALSIGIMWFAILSIKYGVKNIALNKAMRENYPSIRHIIPLALALIWALMFALVTVETFVNPDFIDNTSFGALFIRPFILLSVVEGAISRKIKYYSSMKTIIKMREIGDATWTQN
jgi:hypothetical protein